MIRLSTWAPCGLTVLRGLAVLCGLAAVWGCSRPVQEVRAPGEIEDLPAVAPSSGDWPWWRGVSRDGKAAAGEVPARWSETENIVWRTEVPGRGHSTPTVWGDWILVTTADEQAPSQRILGYDRATGERRWDTVVHRGEFDHAHPKNSHASGSAACDGERAFVSFLHSGAIWVSAIDLSGKIDWQTEAGAFRSKHGYGASPLIYKSLVIVAGDNEGSAFLAALHRKTGKIVWRVQRPQMASFSSPTIADVAGRTQLLISGCEQVASYDPDTGELLWHCEGPTETTACTMVASGDLVFASGGWPDKEILCVRADGRGDVTASHIVWREGRGVTYVPSPLVHNGRLYMVNDDGVATCFEAETGKVIWRERLAGDFSASLVLSGDNLYVPNEQGRTYVFKAADTFQLVAENQLGSQGFATPVICDGQIILRAGDQMFCIAAAP